MSTEAAAAMRSGSAGVIRIAMLEVDIRDGHGDAVRRGSKILADEICRVGIEAAEGTGLTGLSWYLEMRPK